MSDPRVTAGKAPVDPSLPSPSSGRPVPDAPAHRSADAGGVGAYLREPWTRAGDALDPALDAGLAPEATAEARNALVVLPTLNEEAGLRATLEELRAVQGFPGGATPPVLVVDGGSTDGTIAVAEEFGCRVLRQQGTGKGRAMREALAWAAANGYRSIGVLDADGTYPAGRLPTLFRLLDLGYEVVIGVRRPDHPAQTSLRDVVHRVGNGMLNLCAARFGRGPILDVCSGFWGVRSEVVPPLGLRSNGFEIESELFVKSYRHQLRIVQIPVLYRERIGTAKLHAIRDGSRIFLSIVRSSHRGGRAAARPRPRLGIGPHRALTALLAALEPSEIRVVYSSPKRRREAMEIAGDLHEVADHVEIARRFPPGPTTGPSDPTPVAAGASGAPGPEASGTPSAIVTLVDDPARVPGPSPVTLDVPAIGVHLQLDPAPDPVADGPRPSPAPGVACAPGSLSILRASFDPSGHRRETLLLPANAQAADGWVPSGDDDGPRPRPRRRPWLFRELRGIPRG